MSLIQKNSLKISQNDVRRFMSEQKKTILVNEMKVDSPLVNYKTDET